ncbi:RidA family protein [uncultured Thermus sp.]|uniref:RidA family protein n=1 Tax=uncultured Thermus sp. TaxID=157149 RepID=UPI002639B019|nr:RidA family protein [uncultured Thermus sp.]
MGSKKNYVVQPKGWPLPKGYANGLVAQGRVVFIAGMVGWNREHVFESEDFLDQVRQALRNIVEVLAEAGGRPEHLVRLTWFVTDKREYLASLPAMGEVYRSLIGRHYPPMTVVEVKGLLDDRAKVEIEATAVIPD